MKDLIERLDAGFFCREEASEALKQQAAVIEQMLNHILAYHSPDHPLYKKALALQPCPEVLNKVKADAFKAGFMISGEGWNGEYPFERQKLMDSENFVSCLNRYLEKGEV